MIKIASQRTGSRMPRPNNDAMAIAKPKMESRKMSFQFTHYLTVVDLKPEGSTYSVAHSGPEHKQSFASTNIPKRTQDRLRMPVKLYSANTATGPSRLIRSFKAE